MRLSLIFIAALALGASWSAQAQTEGQEARDRFETALAEDCPQKQLQMLSSRDLRDGLDNYLESLSQDTQDRLKKSETDHCSSIEAGAACVNMADIMAADEIGRTQELALSICGSFLRCRTDGDCDYAR